MRTVNRMILGIVIGVMASLMTLAIAQIGVNLLTGVATVGRTIALITLLSGSLLGVVSISLGYFTAGVERSALLLLIGLVIAALAVLGGGYGNGSVLPLGIYGLVMINSFMISRITAVLDESLNRFSGPNLHS